MTKKQARKTFNSTLEKKASENVPFLSPGKLIKVRYFNGSEEDAYLDSVGGDGITLLFEREEKVEEVKLTASDTYTIGRKSITLFQYPENSRVYPVSGINRGAYQTRMKKITVARKNLSKEKALKF